ncbi:hypothetical protein [Paenibacillus thiaminolyticus]|uniref:hypothetical protein n=1 Tax=Paenibacillus thiaminolyticus TaxID=49283 RepID=UPI002543C818|nr:hypothetical protein [Paenibacillus thiaminolyticus]WII39218.1 hypothetical protein O0V01_09060 [Paenibacillus thiaminolyticus]
MYSNQEYVSLMTGDKAAQKRMLATMDKYGEDKWWIAENPDYMARKQVDEDMLLVESEALQKAIEGLLMRSVPFIELKLNAPGIRDEVIERYSEKYR